MIFESWTSVIIWEDLKPWHVLNNWMKRFEGLCSWSPRWKRHYQDFTCGGKDMKDEPFPNQIFDIIANRLAHLSEEWVHQDSHFSLHEMANAFKIGGNSPFKALHGRLKIQEHQICLTPHPAAPRQQHLSHGRSINRLFLRLRGHWQPFSSCVWSDMDIADRCEFSSTQKMWLKVSDLRLQRTSCVFCLATSTTTSPFWPSMKKGGKIGLTLSASAKVFA